MWLTEATQCPVSGKIYLGYFFGIKQLNFLLYISHSRGRFRPSRTITLTIYELVAPGKKKLAAVIFGVIMHPHSINDRDK